MLSADERLDFGALMRELDMSDAQREQQRRAQKARQAQWERKKPQRDYMALPIKQVIQEHSGMPVSYRLALSLKDVAKRYGMSKPTIKLKVKAGQFPLADFHDDKDLSYWTDYTLAQYERDR